MKKFIVWTGAISAIAGIGFQFPRFSLLLMPAEQYGMLVNIFGIMAIFIGIMLIYCSHDLAHRGGLVAWEGILRLLGGTIMVSYGLFGDNGMIAIGSGIFDLAIGLVYIVGLPRHLGVPIINLLLDKHRV
jgi:hypothetical protein